MSGVHIKKVKKAEEKKLEPRFTAAIKKMGGDCLKFYSHFNTSWPDRFILMPGGFFFLAEIKSEGKQLSKRQKLIAKRARKKGFTVFEIDSEASLRKSLFTIKLNMAVNDF